MFYDNLIHENLLIEPANFESIFQPTPHRFHIGDNVNTVVAYWRTLGTSLVVDDYADGCWLLPAFDQGVDTLLKYCGMECDFCGLQLDGPQAPLLRLSFSLRKSAFHSSFSDLFSKLQCLSFICSL